MNRPWYCILVERTQINFLVSSVALLAQLVFQSLINAHPNLKSRVDLSSCVLTIYHYQQLVDTNKKVGMERLN